MFPLSLPGLVGGSRELTSSNCKSIRYLRIRIKPKNKKTMKIIFEITTDSAAFDDYSELPWILKELGHKVHGYKREGLGSLDGLPIMDYNSNRVGQITVEDKNPDMLSALKAIRHFLHFGEPSKAAKVAEEVLGKIEQS